jgi:cytochrome c-type protein NapB
MKQTLRISVAAVAACLAGLAFAAADDTRSLRGLDIPEEIGAAPAKDYVGKRPGTQAPVARTFSTQPPVIPHATENFDEINLETNQCLDCHGADNYKKKKAPEIGKSHFVTRDGETLTQASARRYNCVQCHVPQVDAPPLVENTFKGDEVPKKKPAM